MKNISLKIVAILYTVITCSFVGYVAYMDMLPIKYLVIMIGGVVLLTLINLLGILKGKNIVRKIMFTLIIIGITTGYIFALKYIGSTNNFINTMSKNLKQTEDYYVVLLKDSNISKIEDIDGMELNVFSASEDYDDVKKDVDDKVLVSYKEADNLIELAKNILANKEYLGLISASQYSMITEELENFKSNTKIIYKTTHEIKQNLEENNKDKEDSSLTIKKGIFNVYFSGIDTDGYITNVSRSDANTIATVNMYTHKILLTSIPRDYYVVLHSKGAKDKLTHAGVYGIDETVSTVEDLLKIDINYYIRVNFTTLIDVVDTIDGVNVYSDYDFYAGGYSFKKGYNNLDGKKALAFSRERKSFAGGDRQRIKNQQKVIEAIINKAISSETLLKKYPLMLQKLSYSFQTNISQDEISAIVKRQLNTMKGWTIETNSVDGTGTYLPTYSYGSQLLYVMIPDESTVQNAITKINEVINEK